MFFTRWARLAPRAVGGGEEPGQGSQISRAAKIDRPILPTGTWRRRAPRLAPIFVSMSAMHLTAFLPFLSHWLQFRGKLGRGHPQNYAFPENHVTKHKRALQIEVLLLVDASAVYPRKLVPAQATVSHREPTEAQWLIWYLVE
jgi:hypothetical protein